MPNPTELAIGILISVIVTGGFMILQEQATRVAYFIVRQCAAQLTRHRERREAEWLTQIDECPRGLSQIALATSNLGAVIKDQPSIPLMLLYLVVSTGLIITRPVGVWYVLVAANQVLIKLANGIVDFAEIGNTIMFIVFALIMIPKKKHGDFSWYPEWQFPFKAVQIMFAALCVGALMILIAGDAREKGGVILFIIMVLVTFLQNRKSIIKKAS